LKIHLVNMLSLDNDIILLIANKLPIQSFISLYATSKSLKLILHDMYQDKTTKDTITPILSLLDEFTNNVKTKPIAYKENALQFHHLLNIIRNEYPLFLVKHNEIATKLFLLKACNYYHELLYECSITIEERIFIEDIRETMKHFLKPPTTWKRKFPNFLWNRCGCYMR
jgi:hypothetical protein